MNPDYLAFLRAIQQEQRERPAARFVKADRPFRHAASALGLLTEARAAMLQDETIEWDAALSDCYEAFTACVRAGDHVEGQGNFGGDDFPAAHPKFLECRLTDAGRQWLAGQSAD